MFSTAHQPQNQKLDTRINGIQNSENTKLSRISKSLKCKNQSFQFIKNVKPTESDSVCSQLPSTPALAPCVSPQLHVIHRRYRSSIVRCTVMKVTVNISTNCAAPSMRPSVHPSMRPSSKFVRCSSVGSLVRWFVRWSLRDSFGDDDDDDDDDGER